MKPPPSKSPISNHARPASNVRNLVALWAGRAASFFTTVLVLCAAGAALGALVFTLAGTIGGSTKTPAQLALLGAKTGGFYLLVWAPGLALVREFVRGARLNTTVTAADSTAPRKRAFGEPFSRPPR